MPRWAITWTEEYITYVNAQTKEEAVRIFEESDIDMDTESRDVHIEHCDEIIEESE